MLLGRSSFMNQQDVEEIEKKFSEFLFERSNRSEIEAALAVEFLLENPEQNRCQIYNMAMAAWEHMHDVRPALEPVQGIDTPTPHALCTFTLPDGDKVSMKIEICRRTARLRSMRGNPRERKAAEASWKSKPFTGAFMKSVADRHRAGLRRAATIKE